MVLRLLKGLLLVMFLTLAAGAGCFWYTFMSPYGYHPAEPAVIDQRVEQQDVFVYGTLRNDLLRWVIMGTPIGTRSATLTGYRRHDLDIRPETGAKVEGEVLTVTPEALQALDRYERLGVRYERESVKLADGSIVWVYRRI
ncbi:gamma-glutamylcyclotransferase family protein [Salinicola peritrichatus]|uniref:gamma-glutamylcyclotransferase family protein n=1 Tax=Salinicola peritrichatus TaxID=1267424 RepID=UPI0013A64B27|nr:gamma-glutamylcyclotransferase family protein [Salinicola peritrichatus]